MPGATVPSLEVRFRRDDAACGNAIVHLRIRRRRIEPGVEHVWRHDGCCNGGIYPCVRATRIKNALLNERPG